MDKTDPIDILARTIWGEARGEGVIGMTAIAHVVLNRVEHSGWWGSDVISVCLKTFQFSCWNSDNPNRNKLINVDQSDKQFSEALAIAKNSINGIIDDPTNGADSYITIDLFKNPPQRTDGKLNWWQRLTPVVQIGHHYFYKTV